MSIFQRLTKIQEKYYLGTKTSSTGDAMQVRIGIFRHIIVENNVHTLDIHTTTEQVGGNQNTLKVEEGKQKQQDNQD